MYSFKKSVIPNDHFSNVVNDVINDCIECKSIGALSATFEISGILMEDLDKILEESEKHGFNAMYQMTLKGTLFSNKGVRSSTYHLKLILHSHDYHESYERLIQFF